jgi:D-3-phosphoglycerate dehydrogenase / 2-oxoglutarate reductase
VLRVEELLAQSDYITLHVPYMPATHHLLDLPALSILKPSCSTIRPTCTQVVFLERLAFTI